jgi:hypothetical protein
VTCAGSERSLAGAPFLAGGIEQMARVDEKAPQFAD